MHAPRADFKLSVEVTLNVASLHLRALSGVIGPKLRVLEEDDCDKSIASSMV